VGQVRLQRGQTLLLEGDATNQVYTVFAGILGCYKIAPDGRRQIVAFLFPGDFLGVSIDGEYPYSVEAITQADVCAFRRKAFEGLMLDFPEIEERLLKHVSNELVEAQDHAMLLGRKTASERVASFLLHMRIRLGRFGCSTDVIDLPMRRADIGDYLGLSLETVSRTLGTFRRDGLIALPEPHQVQITRLDRLRNLAEGSADRERDCSRSTVEMIQ